MSIKIAKIEKYIKGTYEKFEKDYAQYWNAGYINDLEDEGKINPIEHAGLAGYNDRMYFVEDMKIRNRDAGIELEAKIGETIDESIRRVEGKENKDMESEEIKKRIDKDLQERRAIISPAKADGKFCIEMRKIINERNIALKIYEELVVKVQRMNLISDKREMQVDTNYQMTEHIKYLEEKYYPKPKPENIKEKVNDIINDIWGYEKSNEISTPNADDIIDSLVELRDEIPE